MISYDTECLRCEEARLERLRINFIKVVEQGSSIDTTEELEAEMQQLERKIKDLRTRL